MPWGWECKEKFVKQLPAKPAEKRGPVAGEGKRPGPNIYDPPQIFWPFKVPGSVVTPHIELPHDKLKVPAPGAYTPSLSVRYKRAPAYSCRPPARPPYQAWDQWTPPPNMYCPPIPEKRQPAYTLGYPAREFKAADFPGPGEHEPKFNYVKRTKPAYSFGEPFKRIKPPKTPPPNTYCEKKFMVSKRTIPAPSFGIRHSPYIGTRDVYLKSSKLDLITSDGV